MERPARNSRGLNPDKKGFGLPRTDEHPKERDKNTAHESERGTQKAAAVKKRPASVELEENLASARKPRGKKLYRSQDVVHHGIKVEDDSDFSGPSAGAITLPPKPRTSHHRLQSVRVRTSQKPSGGPGRSSFSQDLVEYKKWDTLEPIMRRLYLVENRDLGWIQQYLFAKYFVRAR
jgi:hypothetical protein